MLAALPGLENENRIPSILMLEKHLVHFALYKLRYPICPGELQLEADTGPADLCRVCWRHHLASEAFIRHQNVWTLDTMELAMRRKWHEGLERKVKQPLIDEHREVDLARLTDRRQLARLLHVDDTADQELRENGAGVYLGQWFYQKHKVEQQKQQQTGVVVPMPSSVSMPIATSTPVPTPSTMSNSHSAQVLSRVWTPVSIAMPDMTTSSASTSASTAKPSVFLQSPKLASTSTRGLASNTPPTSTQAGSPTRPAASRPKPPAGTPKMPAAMLHTSRGLAYDDNPNLIVPAGPSRYSFKPSTPQLDPVDKVFSSLTASYNVKRIEAPLGTPPPTPPAMDVTTRPDETLIDPSLMAVGGGNLSIKPEKPAPATPSKRVPDDPRAFEKKNRVVPIRTTTGGKSLDLLEMYTDDDAEEADDRGGSDDPMQEDDADEAEIREASDDIRAMTVDREDMVTPVVAPAPLPPALDALAMSDGVSGAAAMQLVMNFIADSQKCEAELKQVKIQYEGDKTIWNEKEKEYRDLNKKMEAENKRLRRERNSARDDWKVSEADRVRFKNKLEHAVADKTDLEEQVRGLRVKLAALA